MENILLKYFSARHEQQEQKRSSRDGPVITISREYGCPAKEFAYELKKELDQRDPMWRIISKEILDEAAKELQLSPSQLEYVFRGEKRSSIDEILSALSSRYYKNDRQIRKTMQKIILQIGQQGYAIILGRCGVCITHGIERSLHIKLEAPEAFRIRNIMEWQKLDRQAARERMDDMDKKRVAVRNNFAGGEFDPHQFDLRINMERFNVHAAVEMAMKAINGRQLL